MIYEPVEVVIDKLIRTFKLREWQYDIEECVENIAEALKLIGAAKIYAEKAQILTINSMVAPLPRDLQHIKDISPTYPPYRESGSFIEIDAPDGTQFTLTYQAMPVDTRGYVLVPDRAEVREAIMWYMVKILTLQKEITGITFQVAESEWQWRCSSARASLNVWSVQQAHSAYNDFVRLNPRKDVRLKEYKEIGTANTFDRTKQDNYTNFP